MHFDGVWKMLHVTNFKDNGEFMNKMILKKVIYCCKVYFD